MATGTIVPHGLYLALGWQVPGLRDQVIHGDLNYHNILIAPPGSGLPPAFIDMGPYWRLAP